MNDGPPIFDECITIDWEGEPRDVITHRDASGSIFAWHSPLDDGVVSCSLCTTPGTRVFMNLGDDE